MDTVFVSYEKHDAPLAEDMVAFLEGHGIPCWIAPRDISSGEDYGGEITRAIRNASVVILIGSEWTRKSIHVRNEVGLAFREGLTIIPYCTGECRLGDSLDFFLATTHRIIPSEDKTSDFSAIAELVRSKSVFLPSMAAGGKHPRRGRTAVIIAAAILVAAILGLWSVRYIRMRVKPLSSDAVTGEYVAEEPQYDGGAIEDTVSVIKPPVLQAAQALSVPEKRRSEIGRNPEISVLPEAVPVAEPVELGDKKPDTLGIVSPGSAGEDETTTQESLVSLLTRTRVMADLEGRLQLRAVTIDTDADVLASSYLLISDSDGYIKSILSPVGDNGARTNLFTGVATERVHYTKSDRVSYIHE